MEELHVIIANYMNASTVLRTYLRKRGPLTPLQEQSIDITLAVTRTLFDGWQREDYATAFREFKSLAEKGAAEAQNILGVMYDKGQGVPQDYVQAYMWLTLAAAQGVKQATEARDRLASQMSSAQIEEAQQLAHEWKPKK